MEDFKFTLENPQPFDVDGLLGAMGPASHGFRRTKIGSVVWLMQDDVLGQNNFPCANSFLSSSGSPAPRRKWVRHTGFELDDDGRLTAIIPGAAGQESYALILLLKDKTFEGFQAIEAYTNGADLQKGEAVDLAAARSPVVYQHQNPPRQAVVAGVRQGACGYAQGPCDGVGYIGTRGLGPCIGLVLVTKTEGGGVPCVSLAHLDASVQMDTSVSMMLGMGGHRNQPGPTRAALVTGQRSNKHVMDVARALSRNGIEPAYDIAHNASRDMVVSLETGEILAPDPFLRVGWLGPNAQQQADIDALFNMKVKASLMGGRSPVKREFDLRQGLPEGYTVHRPGLFATVLNVILDTIGPEL